MDIYFYIYIYMYICVGMFTYTNMCIRVYTEKDCAICVCRGCPLMLYNVVACFESNRATHEALRHILLLISSSMIPVYLSQSMLASFYNR